MHAMVVRVKVNDTEAAQRQLREEVVPRVAQAPGFVAGYWTRKDDDDTGLSMVIFDSEQAATQMSERVPSSLPEGVELQSIEIREVVASA
jgi:heme-degrading monooxygenase HmoA